MSNCFPTQNQRMKFFPELSISDDRVPVKDTPMYEVWETPFGLSLRVRKRLDGGIINAIRRENANGLEIFTLEIKEPIDLNILRDCCELRSLYLHIEKLLDWTPLQFLGQAERLTLLARGYRPQALTSVSLLRPRRRR